MAPDDPAIQHNYGIWLHSIGEFEDEREAYRRALAVDECYYPSLMNLALSYHQCQNPTLVNINQAIESYRTLLRCFPSKLEVTEQLGLALCQVGAYEEGLLNLERSLQYRRKDLESSAPVFPSVEHEARLNVLVGQSTIRQLENPPSDVVWAERGYNCHVLLLETLELAKSKSAHSQSR